MISMITTMNTILARYFENGNPVTPTVLNASIYLAQLHSLNSRHAPIMEYEQFIIGESFPISVGFNAKFSSLNLHKPIQRYVTDAAGNKEVYDIGHVIHDYINLAENTLRGQQDHQVITYLTQPGTSWFRYRYQEPYDGQPLSTDELKKDADILLL